MIYISELLEEQEMITILDSYQVGVESIAFSIGNVLDDYSGNIRMYREQMKRRPPCPLSLHGPFLDLNPISYDSGIRRVSRERFEKTYEAAQALGAKKIIYHTCLLPQPFYEIDWSRQMADFWNEFLRDKDTSIQVCMENVYDRKVLLFGEVADLVEHPAFSLCLDIGHVHAYTKERVEDWMKQLTGKIGHFHFHDNHGDEDEHLALGKGGLPLERLADTIHGSQLPLQITLENTSLKEVQQSLEQLKKMKLFTEEKPEKTEKNKWQKYD